jgi:hypothetical protein
MTVFGKILTVFVLLFSVVLGALNVLIYMRSVNWKNYGDKQGQRAETTEASERSLKDQYKKAVEREDAYNVELQRVANVQAKDDVKKKVDTVLSEMAAKDAQVNALMAQVRGLETDLQAERKASADLIAAGKARDLEAAQSLTEKNTLKNQLNAAEAANVKLLDAANKARDKQVAAEIARIALQEVNKQLEERTQDLVKENVRLAKQLAGGNTGPAGVTLTSLSAPNPPSFKVEGKVLGTTPDGLVEISVGSDAGLKKGHTLEAFRTSPKAQYLCMIRLITVDHNKSVGQIVGKQVQLQRGDNVSSKITD